MLILAEDKFGTISEPECMPYTYCHLNLWASAEPSAKGCGCETESIDVSHLISTSKPDSRENVWHVLKPNIIS